MGKRKVLFLEDDDALREALIPQLEQLELEVHTAESCAESQRLLATDSFDLLILDRSLPDGDGLTKIVGGLR